MSSRSPLGRYGQPDEKPGNLRSCGCARRYLPSPPLVSPPVNGPGRSRSSTGSSGGGGAVGGGVKSRSRTPSNVSSGRTTPSPTRGNGLRNGMGDRTVSESALLNLQEPPAAGHPRFVSSFHLKPKALLAQYTTTVLIRIGSCRRHHIEEIKYELRLTPNKQPTNTTDGKNIPSTDKHKSRRYKTEFEVELQQPDTTLIKIHQPTLQTDHDRNRTHKEDKNKEDCKDTAEAHLP
ncbi:uncharacterized protein LOC142323991 [Lycorma delicatula]|uniref:uncharacterized protein LOC142323991 n=1 Tax=Lycorma delicatula TaxID=130591 RepID=UPI003F514168